MKNKRAFEHPAKVLIPLKTALASWADDGAIYEEKLDGQFTMREWLGNTIAGELMPGDRFVAWDILATASGGDCRMSPAIDRLTALVRWRAALAADGIGLVEFTMDDGAALLRRVLARGGEGVVRKLCTASYHEPMQAAKRGEIFVCRVTGIGGLQSVGICDAATGADRGRVSLRGGKCDQVRVGSIIRVEGMNLTAARKIRQPQPCREWLVKY